MILHVLLNIKTCFLLMKMSESTQDKISRLVAEAVEARKHDCEQCGHPGSEHVFDFVATNGDPCKISCMICMGMKK